MFKEGHNFYFYFLDCGSSVVVVVFFLKERWAAAIFE